MEVPRTFLGRGVGLMFRARLEPGQGMLIRPCSGIHMFFMRFPIDAVFLDRRSRVRRVCRGLKPWRVVPWVPGARAVVELPAGSVEGLDLARGEPLVLEP